MGPHVIAEANTLRLRPSLGSVLVLPQRPNALWPVPFMPLSCNPRKSCVPPTLYEFMPKPKPKRTSNSKPNSICNSNNVDEPIGNTPLATLDIYT